MPPIEQLQLVRLKHDNSLPGFFKLFQASRVVLDQKMDYGLLFVLNDGLINYKIPLSLMFYLVCKRETFLFRNQANSCEKIIFFNLLVYFYIKIEIIFIEIVQLKMGNDYRQQ